MLVHSVYFWLKTDLTPESVEAFWTSVRSLLTINTVRHGWVGVPAETPDRPVIDKSYSCALVLAFDTEADHDSYQVDPVHDAFRNESHSRWSKIQIYDAVG
ncbi:MAG: Dabb family protein [Acidobacteriota bacterium]